LPERMSRLTIDQTVNAIGGGIEPTQPQGGDKTNECPECIELRVTGKGAPWRGAHVGQI
jgi:hypothetical protein